MGSPQAGSDIAERLLELAVGVVRISGPMSRSYAGRHISEQLVRSATSAGANYEEACGSQSRGDFIHKLHLVLKELRESAYWLKLSVRAGLAEGGQPDDLQREAG
ncbi:MAG: four helix bundle protein, partial [Planctomycetota bacterium]